MINEFLHEGKRATQWELSAHQIQGSSAIVKREKLTQLLVILKISAWPVLFWPVLFHSSLPSFPSVQGWFAPGRTSLQSPSTSMSSWKLSKSPKGTFSSFM